jgi:hypothetical protein
VRANFSVPHLPFFQGRLFRLFCHPDRSGRLFPPLGSRAPAAEWRDRGAQVSHTQVDETKLTNNGLPFFLSSRPERPAFSAVRLRASAAQWRDRGIRFSHTHVDETNLTNNGLPFFCHPDRSGRLFPPLGSRAPAAEWRDRGAQVSHTQVDETKPPSIKGILSPISCRVWNHLHNLGKVPSKLRILSLESANRSSLPPVCTSKL